MANDAQCGIALSVVAHFAAATNANEFARFQGCAETGTGRSKMCIKQLYVLTVRGPYIN
jgi:hypothetical protein